MPHMNVDQIRETFVRFYTERGHTHIPSASLVPHDDPTLLFTSAGMVPFKPYFMGLADPPATRMVTVQKVFRTTDIDSVGDYNHLTFFEMLGNFSVGDYFKKEAIQWAWELLTEGFKLPKDKLWVSIYEYDKEAHDLWRKIGVPQERIQPYGEEHNYWFSGDVGPCGPNSEIFVDRGPREICAYCRDDTCKPNLEPDCGRFNEVWNLVFMTEYRQEDGTRTELPKKNIDTGSGLERMAVQLQGKDTVYETDVFSDIIARVAELSGKRYGDDHAVDTAMRIVAEHARAATFLITDGVLPSNEGRGYVLRRILRRAVYHLTQLSRTGRMAGATEATLLDQVAESVIAKMQRAHPDLRDRAEFTLRLLSAEEAKFRETLERGSALLNELIALRTRLWVNWDGDWSRWFGQDWPKQLETGLLPQFSRVIAAYSAIPTGLREAMFREVAAALRRTQTSQDVPGALLRLSGVEAFTLYDTYGYPVELTNEIVPRRLRLEDGQTADLTVDTQSFQREMDAQRERGRAAAKFEIDADRTEFYAQLAHVRSRFVGYDATRHDTTVAAIVGLTGVRDTASEGDEVEVVLAQTPFYPEGGGQVGDTGEIAGPSGRVAVEDTQSPAEGLIVHRGRVVQGHIAVNDAVRASVDTDKRRASQRNHTATHLLHAALRQVLGTHVKQAGSLVAPDRLRFDFTHIEATKPEELAAVQRLVNEKVREDIEVHCEEQPYDQAIAGGAMALFGEKYHASVRVVDICEPPTTNDQRPPPQHRCFSKELCGGTHCHRTGEIGTFVIAGESSVGSGLRRIEALTGPLADAYVLEQQATVARLARRLNATPAELEARVEALETELEAERRRLQQLERQAGRAEADALLAAAEKVGETSLVVARVTAADAEAMREIGDVLRERLGSAVVVLGMVADGRPTFVAMATKDLAKKVHAGNLIKQVAAVAGGGGGGRPDMAQAGGKDAAKLDAALEVARSVAREMLGAVGG